MKHTLSKNPWNKDIPECSVCNASGEELEKLDCITQGNLNEYARLEKEIENLQIQSTKISDRFEQKVLSIGRLYLDKNRKFHSYDDEDYFFDCGTKTFVYFAQDEYREKCIHVEIPVELLLSENIFDELDKCKLRE